MKVKNVKSMEIPVKLEPINIGGKGNIQKTPPLQPSPAKPPRKAEINMSITPKNMVIKPITISFDGRRGIPSTLT